MNKPTYEQLQSQLAAALAKNKELEKDYAIWKEYTGKVNDKNIELEQRIKESQEHKPIAWCYGVQDGDLYGPTKQRKGNYA